MSSYAMDCRPQISSDRRFDVFASDAKILVPTDTDSSLEFFVRDRE